jgi:hypothetical protein
VLIIFEALLLPVLIDAARQWPPMQNSSGQRRGGAALKKQINWGAWVAPPTNKYTLPQTTTSSMSATSSKHLQPIQCRQIQYDDQGWAIP